MHFINLESSIAYWRYSVKLTAFEAWLVVALITSCDIVFWFWGLEKLIQWTEKRIKREKFPKKILSKIVGWMTKKRNRVYERHENNKRIKWFKAIGHPGLYVLGIIPSLSAFLIGVGIQKMFIQTKLGYLCLWLGAITRITLVIFFGLKMLDLIINVFK